MKFDRSKKKKIEQQMKEALKEKKKEYLLQFGGVDLK